MPAAPVDSRGKSTRREAKKKPREKGFRFPRLFVVRKGRSGFPRGWRVAAIPRGAGEGGKKRREISGWREISGLAGDFGFGGKAGHSSCAAKEETPRNSPSNHQQKGSGRRTLMRTVRSDCQLDGNPRIRRDA